MSRYLEIADRIRRELGLMDQAKQEVEAATLRLPSCPRCSSYALYRLEDGTTDCGTCGHNFPTVRMIRSM